MSQPVQTLKGFRDFIGVEARKRQWLMNAIRTVYEQFGFEPLETPTLEYESLLLGKYGDEADKLIYGFEDKGGRRVALRYDQTVPTARIISQYRNQLIFPYKRYQIQNVWRADKPQKGRYREFTQCDADVIGSTSLVADAEILAVYAAIYEELGLTSLKIKINDRQQLMQTIKNAGIEESQIFSTIQTIDKLDKKTETEVLQELQQRGISKEVAVKLLNSLNTNPMLGTLQGIVQMATEMGVKEDTFIFTPTLARGLDYYTGMIFEGVIPEYAVGSVGGGGRYDNLIGDLVDVSMPAVGFGLGFDRTLEAAEVLGKIPEEFQQLPVLVTVFGPELLNRSVKMTGQLRKQGIAAECYLEAKKLDAQLKYANAKSIKYVIILGPDEVSRDTVQLKNMETRESKEVKVSEVASLLK